MKFITIFTLVLAAVSTAKREGNDFESSSTIEKSKDLTSSLSTDASTSTQQTISAIAVQLNQIVTTSTPASEVSITRIARSANTDNTSDKDTSSDNKNTKKPHGSTSNSGTKSSSLSASSSTSKHSSSVSGSTPDATSTIGSSTLSSASTDATSLPTVHCNTNGSTMCDSSSATGFFTCTNNLWVSMTCSTGNECRTVNDEAVCMNPADPTPSDLSDVSAPKIPCDSLNSTMCDSSSKSSFYMCLDYNWTKMQCDGANVCMERNGSTACVDQATADAPQLPCTTANATQCVDGDMTLFQICVDNYWTNSSCSDNNYCLYRGGQALCVDKATAEAPVQPCTTANATRCVDNDDTVFQICYDNFWTNSTCSAGTICGTKQGNAVCHDPTIPIIDVPDQPCDVEKATRCFSGNHTIYQLCYNGLWSNQTCDGGNVCFTKDSDATCMDPTLASIEGATFILSSPEQFRALSSAVSLSNVYSWGTAVLLCAIVTAFGAGI